MADERAVDDEEEEVVVMCVPMRVVELRYTTDSGWTRRLLVDSGTRTTVRQIVPPAPWSTRDGNHRACGRTCLSRWMEVLFFFSSEDGNTPVVSRSEDAISNPPQGSMCITWTGFRLTVLYAHILIVVDTVHTYTVLPRDGFRGT
jgi:hypothetical protein